MNNSSAVLPIRNGTLERSLPNSEDSERIILGGVLLDNRLISQVADVLSPGDLYSVFHRRVYAGMVSLHKQARPIDHVLIFEEMKKEGPVDAIGGAGVIANLTYGIPHFDDLSEYVAIVKENALFREVLRILNLYQTRALTRDGAGDVSTFVSEISSKLSSIAENGQDIDAPARDIALSFVDLQTVEVDERPPVIAGLYREQVGLIYGATNEGKSTLLRNGAISCASGRPYKPFYAGGEPIKVLIVDNEDGKRQLRDDLVKMALSLSPDQRTLLNSNLKVICDEEIAGSELRLNISRHFNIVSKAAKEYGADLILIETLSAAFQIANENDNAEAKEVIMKALKRLAKQTNAAVLATDHIGKAKQEDGANRSPAHKGRGASSKSDQAKLIWTIERNYLNEKTVLTCAKIKGSKIPTVTMSLDQETRWFEVHEDIKLTSSYEAVLSLFEDGEEFTTAEILEKLSKRISSRSIKANLAQAVKCNDLEKVKHGVYRKASVLQFENESAKVQNI